MGITAFLFPGQGSQYVGMARDLFGSAPRFESLVALGSEAVGEDLARVCRRGPDRKLMSVRCLQPLVVAVSLGYLHELTVRGVSADVILGHSLGEITALAAAGVLSDRRAVEVAVVRGDAMADAAADAPGGAMAVSLNSEGDRARLLEVIEETADVDLANDNAPAQIVVSGPREALDGLKRRVAGLGIGRSRRLLVAGPWHSRSMAPAREVFERWVEPLSFAPPRLSLVLNATGREESDPDVVKRLVSRQLCRPVLWRQSMEWLKQLGVDTVIEVGPGRVLSGLARANGLGQAVAVHNVESVRKAEELARDNGDNGNTVP